MLTRTEEILSLHTHARNGSHVVMPKSGRKPRRLRGSSNRHLEYLEPREMLAANPNPVLAVAGNGLNIGFHDNSPRLQDGTDLGTLPTGVVTAQATFQITDAGGAALTLTNPTPVTFSGTNAADFSVGSLVNHTDGSSTLVVNYAPSAAGTSNATVHIASNDPKHPDFTFAVRGTLAFTDYAIALGNIKVPAGTVVTSGKTSFMIPVKITNPGGLAVTGTASSAEVQIFLHNTTSGTNTLVTTLPTAKLTGLGATGSRTFNLKVTPPVGFSSGTYSFLAVVNADGALAESNPITLTPGANNSAQSVATVTLAQAHVDLLGNLVSTTIPTGVSAVDAIKGKLVVSVANQGNVTLPANEKISIEVRAHSSSGDIVLGTFSNLPVGGLGAKPKSFTLNINGTAERAEGTYQIEAFVTATPAITEDSTVNNLLTQTSSGQTFSVVSAAAFNNLTGVLGKSTLPTRHAANTPLQGTLQVTITNSGTATLPVDQEVILQIFANAFPLANSPSLAVGSLAPGQSLTFTVTIDAADGLSAGHYTLHAQIDTVPGLVESSLDDNVISLNAHGAPISLTIV